MSKQRSPVRPDSIPLGAVLLVGIIWASPAYAYLDPGMGSFLVQMLAAILFGVSLFFRRVLARGLSFLGCGRSAAANEAKDDKIRDDRG